VTRFALLQAVAKTAMAETEALQSKAPRSVPQGNAALDGALTAAGVSHVYALHAGGHDVALWQAHASPWLSLALAHLRSPAAL
jgi:enterochelin esterase-like enzyme